MDYRILIAICFVLSVSSSQAQYSWDRCSDAEGYFKTENGIVVSPEADPGESIFIEKVLKSMPVKTITGTCESVKNSSSYVYMQENLSFEVYQMSIDGWVVRNIDMLCTRGSYNYSLEQGLSSVCAGETSVVESYP
ncbi:MAG: hypothetical protein K2Q26_11850 [Bdellovibrionales bacterium]|nr:hypothetical protein [Bdellovibrionales bacterium]